MNETEGKGNSTPDWDWKNYCCQNIHISNLLKQSSMLYQIYNGIFFYRNSGKSHKSLCNNNNLEQLKIFKKSEQIEVLKLQFSGNMTKSSKSR